MSSMTLFIIDSILNLIWTNKTFMHAFTLYCSQWALALKNCCLQLPAELVKTVQAWKNKNSVECSSDGGGRAVAWALQCCRPTTECEHFWSTNICCKTSDVTRQQNTWLNGESSKLVVDTGIKALHINNCCCSDGVKWGGIRENMEMSASYVTEKCRHSHRGRQVF